MYVIGDMYFFLQIVSDVNGVEDNLVGNDDSVQLQGMWNVK